MLRRLFNYLFCVVLGIAPNNTFAKDTLTITLNLSKKDYLDIEKKIINIPIFDLKRTDTFFCAKYLFENFDFEKIIGFNNIYLMDKTLFSRRIEKINGKSKDNTFNCEAYHSNINKNTFIIDRISFNTAYNNIEYMSTYREEYPYRKAKKITFIHIYNYIINNPDDFVFKLNEADPYWCVHNNKLYILDINKKGVFLSDYYNNLFQKGIKAVGSNDEILRSIDLHTNCSSYKNKTSEFIDIKLK
ncbi:MAG TPA: hypothetical protein PKX92_14300 [Edaphocola sp.]|nr:hypothetical protein [Edaphocola sp.]